MRRLPLLATVTAAACAHRVELPMTARDLGARPRVPELVAYLGQPDADPEVCDEGGSGPTPGSDVGTALVDALRGGEVAPGSGGACLTLLLPRLDRAGAAKVA